MKNYYQLLIVSIFLLCAAGSLCAQQSAPFLIVSEAYSNSEMVAELIMPQTDNAQRFPSHTSSWRIRRRNSL